MTQQPLMATKMSDFIPPPPPPPFVSRPMQEPGVCPCSECCQQMSYPATSYYDYSSAYTYTYSHNPYYPVTMEYA